MNILKYIALSVVAGLACGCTEETQLGEQNKGKERPSVEISVDRVEAVADEYGSTINCTFSLSVSDGAAEYGYVVLYGEDTVIPGAYSILAGEVTENIASGVFFHNDGDTPAQYSFSFSLLPDEVPDDFTVCAAAITSEGLTSEVAVETIDADDIVIPEPEPDFTVLRGRYIVRYATDDRNDKPLETETPDMEFVMGLSPFEGIRPAGLEDEELYVFAGCWFNMAEVFGLTAGAAVPPQLVGVLDKDNLTITFDYMLDPSSVGSDRTQWRIQEASPYQTALQSGEELYMFRGGGNGEEPVVMTLDEDGMALELSSFGFAHIDQDAADPIVAYYDRTDGNAELEYSPQ